MEQAEETIERLCRDALRRILNDETNTRSAMLLMRIVEKMTTVMGKTKNAVDCIDRILRAT